MKTCLFIVAFLVATPAAWATDWKFLAAHDDQSVALYYDRHSVRRSGDIVKVRVKRVFSEDEGREIAASQGFADIVAYSVEYTALDCARKRRANLRVTWFGVEGKVLDRTISSDYSWRDMRPKGLGQALCEELD